MKKSTLTLAIMALMGSSTAFAASPNVEGGSSDISGVETGASDHILFDGDNSGVALNGAGSYIDLAGGPINGSNNAIDDHGNGAIMTPGDMGLPNLPIDVAQVWKADAAVNGGGNTYANFAINSVRQITTLSFAPQFGGLVIGQVGANSTGSAADPAEPLSVGEGVYFGEWAPRDGTPPQDSTDLNMDSDDRTVWYVGDNAVDSTPDLVNAEYNVVGIRQTGEGSNLPGSPELYTGVLTANYGTGTNSLAGSIDRGTETVDFTGTTIGSDGTFDNGSNPTIEGRFYNGAEALAGIYTGGTSAADHVAFGGSHNGNGSISQ